MHAGLLPAGSLNHIRAGMGIPDSAFSGNALAVSLRALSIQAHGFLPGNAVGE
jgi:hypothetical protein